jgi:transposase-like protein
MRRIDLSHRPRSREQLSSWYAAVLDDQESSGLSVAKYADELGVTAATLYQWRRRLAADDAVEQDLSRPFGLVEVVPHCAVATVRTESSFVVRLGHDRGIEVPHEFDDVELRRLVAVLESC